MRGDGNSEGLVRYRDGYANALYGTNWWECGMGVANEHNFQNVFYEIAKGICVPSYVLELKKLEDCYNVYCKCSPLQSIVNRTADALTNGTWKIKDSEGDDVSTSSPKNKKIVALLKRPNPLQSYTDMLKTISIYKAVYGGAFIYAGMPIGSDDIKDAATLHVFSPLEVDIKWKDNLNFLEDKIEDLIDKYVICPKNTDTKIEVNPKHVLFLYDTSEAFYIFKKCGIVTNGTRLKSLFYEIRNIMQAQEAIYSLNADRGAQGIISNTAKDSLGYVPMTGEEKQRLQDRFRSNYGMRRDQDKVFITDASVDYTPIGFNVKDLMLFEGVRENIMHLCDSYNYPFDLLASEKGKTAADKRTSMAGLYQDNIIPFSIDLSDKLSIWFGLDIQKETIQIDYSHLNIFQQGNVEKNNALRQLMQALHIAYNGQTITREEFRRMIGLAPALPLDGTLREETGADFARDDVRITTSELDILDRVLKDGEFKTRLLEKLRSCLIL